ncbi:MAG: hypothetical protein ACD_79C01414G0002 [uncultured bacterium]|nr:MAG: hypothetical protein ACD_79C01414G0002 [uncultured bacterium]
MNTTADGINNKTFMKALVYNGPNSIVWEEKPKPVIKEGTDAIVQITTTTICGTDLHILKGDLPAITKGRILGHEGVGIIDEVGANVLNFHKGDKVLISIISSCGRCGFCRKAMPSHCLNGGWQLGNRIDGTQAEYVRIPYADNGLYLLPGEVEEEAVVMLSCILPTGLECGAMNGQVKPGDIVAIVGAGPVGMAALLTTQLYSPSMIVMIDIDDNRLKIASSLGASHVVNSSDGQASLKVMEFTQNAGVNVAIEAVGVSAAFDICQSIIAPGGRIANVGVHAKAVELHLEKLWALNMTLTTRLVDGGSTPMLLKMIQSGRLDAKKLVSHRYKLSEVIKAYDTFANAQKLHALKVILWNEKAGE